MLRSLQGQLCYHVPLACAASGCAGVEQCCPDMVQNPGVAVLSCREPEPRHTLGAMMLWGPVGRFCPAPKLIGVSGSHTVSASENSSWGGGAWSTSLEQTHVLEISLWGGARAESGSPRKQDLPGHYLSCPCLSCGPDSLRVTRTIAKALPRLVLPKPRSAQSLEIPLGGGIGLSVSLPGSKICQVFNPSCPCLAVVLGVSKLPALLQMCFQGRSFPRPIPPRA